MSRIYISIGSNISPEKNIRDSIVALGQLFGDLEVSPVYQSSAVGFEGPEFLNLVVAADTDISAGEVAVLLKNIERNQGRDRGQGKFSDRTLDLDLLLYGDEAVDTHNLNLPSKEIENYAFVLTPLVDLAGQKRHPLSGRSYTEMLNELRGRASGQFVDMHEVEFIL